MDTDSRKMTMDPIANKPVINNTTQKILSFVDTIIILTSKQGIIVEANRSACELFGYCRPITAASMPKH